LDPEGLRIQILFNSIQTFVVNLMGGQELLPLYFHTPSSQIYGVGLNEDKECDGLLAVPSLNTCEFLGVGHQT